MLTWLENEGFAAGWASFAPPPAATVAAAAAAWLPLEQQSAVEAHVEAYVDFITALAVVMLRRLAWGGDLARNLWAVLFGATPGRDGGVAEHVVGYGEYW